MRSIASVPYCREQGCCDSLEVRNINISMNNQCVFTGSTIDHRDQNLVEFPLFRDKMVLFLT